MVGGGWRVELFAKFFHVAINGGNGHGLGETGKSRAIVVCISCHLSSFSISLALIRGGDAIGVVSGFVESREVSKTELAETTSHYNIGIVFAVRRLGMKDQCVKDESKVAEGKTGALIIWG